MSQLNVEKTFQAAVGHHQAGRLPQAEAAYRQILAQQPHHAGALHHLGMIASQMGRNDVAVELLRHAIAHHPNYAEVYGNLGNALWRLGQLDEAIRAYRQAIALRPGFAEVCYNLGLALGEKGQPEEAIAAWRQAIGVKSNYPQAFNNIGNVLKDSGKVEEAVAAFRQAIALDPAFSVAHSNLVLAMRNHPAYDAATIAQEHACWNRQHAEPLKQFIQPHTNDRDPDRRLRIGYVSPDLRQHSVAYFLENLLAEHDSASVEVICYCDVVRPDATTARLQKLCTQWRTIVGMTNAQADQKVREDRIDILVDLAGHTANNRLLLFARKPAPIQVAYLGYPDTTGLATMDYRLTDAFADPPGTADDSYSEQLVRLPETFLCYRPPDAAPEIGAVPALAIGAVTFGSFNALSKINAPLVAMWSKLLHEIPNSRLILKSLGLGGAAARQHILESFAAHHIGPDRIELIGWTANKTEHLQLYNRIDMRGDVDGRAGDHVGG